ncbi:interleukin-1 receptor type 2-like [Eublepharis macularius]|uniref:Interleukin-1 receptor type 2-like n=1 Tax=Eublepharis macularius TaxID=481883 RepID=A0AA97J3L5_EUBMA|nr:interleukin-1 receptor type 2-like [Eublepharis macularius]
MPAAPALPSRVHGLFLALLCSCTCLEGTGAKLQAFISSPLQISASFGQCFSVQCEGYTAFRSGNIYWLANGTFVEDLYPDGAVIEEDARKVKVPGRHLLQRELVFRSFSEQDLHTTFKCVILDPFGPAQKTLTWLPPKEDGPETGGSGSGGLEDP